jgi:protein-ribulosamine 3-kinase
MIDWEAIAEDIGRARGERFHPGTPHSVGGGCINRAYSLGKGNHRYFVKLNGADRLSMFQAEAAGLQEMADTVTIRVPRPLCVGVTGARSYIVMEYIALGGHRSGGEREAGRQLAAMHRASRQGFGWDLDNTIGSTPQPNGTATDWVEFWRRQRLGFQLDLAARNGYQGQLREKGERLLDALPVLIGHRPLPSLLHGDLWGGNLGFDGEGHPVIFDPAVYYGDREADVAMTELFGGFGGDFYAAYNEAWKLDPGYGTRKVLYNLYHILNHLNLFGTGYLARAQDMIERLLAQAG